MAAGKATFMLDLKAIFGTAPKDDALRARIEQRAIDMIKERTAEGKDKNGKAFEGYSESYKNSLAFKAAGKDNNVNMSLFGDMLALMDVIDTSPTASWIGWNDELQNAKAWRHTTGDMGMPKRDFLGLTPIERRTLKAEFAESMKEDSEENMTQEDIDTLALIELIKSRQEDDGD